MVTQKGRPRMFTSARPPANPSTSVEMRTQGRATGCHDGAMARPYGSSVGVLLVRRSHRALVISPALRMMQLELA